MTERLLTDDLAARLAQLTPERRALVERALRQAAASTANDSVTAPATTTIPRRAEGVVVPLTSGQEVLWTLQRALPSLSAYNVPRVFSVRGPLDADALRAALGAIATRHEALRTRYPEVAGAPRQMIAAGGEVAFELVDLREQMPNASADVRERDASRLIAERIRAPFDLATDVPMRVLVARVADEEWRVLILTHHIASDEGSRDVLYRELATLYAAARAGTLDRAVATLPALPVQYGDFAVWQQSELASGALDGQLAYWRERLAGLSVLDLPTDRRSGTTPDFAGARFRVTYGLDVRDGVRRLAGASGASPYMVLLAAVKALLHRYTAQSDIAVGAPVAGRRIPELEGVIGYFPSQIVLRTQVDADASFSALVERVRATFLGAFDHQDVPIERLMEEVTGRDDPSAPLFRVSVQMAGGGESTPSLEGAIVEPVATDVGNSKFDLLFGFDDAADGLRVLIEYRTELYDASTIERLAGHLEELIRSAIADASTPVAALTLLRDAEREQLLEGFAGERVRYDGGETLVARLSAQVARTPEAVAVVDDRETVTYGELDARATLLARVLRSLGVGPGVLVGVCAERGVSMVVGLVAVLKSGGAYVPIDPEYPAERQTYMLADSDVTVLLTQTHLAGGLPAHRAELIVLDDATAPWAAHSTSEKSPVGAVGTAVAANGTEPLPLPSPDDPAYMIYTSGSTGQPKGALNGHRGIVNRLAWMQAEYRLTPDDVVLQKTPFSFDVSVWEFFWPLIAGAKLVMARPGGHRDPSYLALTMARHRVTVCHFVPSMLRAYLADENAGAAIALRAVMASGEALPPDLVAQFYVVLPESRLHNLYGPTECAVDVSYFACPPSTVAPSVVPIGRAVSNTRLYVLDARKQPVPIGVPGELYLAGVQVGLGYHNRPELTAERFVADPYAPAEERSAQRAPRTAQSAWRPPCMYKTGDRARWRADGTMEYLGRLDFQVKLRGFRIELGEIESVILEVDGVRAAAVLVRRDTPGDERLVAYVEAVDGEAPTAATLRARLQSRMPDYMVPTNFVFVDAMPLSPSGKLDRRALPAPGVPSDGVAEYAAPRTLTEQRIAGIFASVLRAERIGVNDDFFALGGHSLLAMRVVARLAAVLPRRLTIGEMFEARTVAALATLADTSDDAADAQRAPRLAPRLERATDREVAPLTPAQQAVWTAEQRNPDSAAYNAPMVLRLRGALNPSALEAALDAVVARHEILRTAFEERLGEAVQVAHPSVTVPVRHLDLREDVFRLDMLLRETVQAPFVLNQAPLIRALIARMGESEWVVAFVAHHLAFDGGSEPLFLRDLASAYDAIVAGATPELAPLPIAFADYARWEHARRDDGGLDSSLAYWRQALDGAPAAIDLPGDWPTDGPREARADDTAARVTTVFPAALTETLTALARAQGATMFVVLLAGFQALLSRFSRQSDLVVGAPVSGRDSLETQQLIGFLANTLPLRVTIEPETTFADLVVQGRERLLSAFAHSTVPVERVSAELGRAALFDTLFVLQEAREASPRFAGCEAEPLAVEIGSAKFDLSLSMTPTPGGLRAVLIHRTARFRRETAERLLEHLGRLLASVAATPSIRIADLALLGEADRAQLAAWNDTRVEFPEGHTLVSLIDAAAARTPDAIVVEDERESLTFAAFDARVRHLAVALRARGVKPGTLVGLCAERAVGMVVGMVGILKAGGAYVPIDPEYPAERVAYMLEDANIRVLLTQSHLTDKLPLHAADELLLDDPAQPWACDGEEAPVVDPNTGPDDLAYMIYTSGSTGRPKGALNAHRGIVNRLQWGQSQYSLTPADVVLQKTPFSFDVSLWEFFWPLITGARLVLARPGGHRDTAYLTDVIPRAGITVCHFVPSMLRGFLVDPGLARCTGLRYVFASGEALAPELVSQLYESLPSVRLHNLYGPTECGVEVSYWACPVSAVPPAVVPIGKPTANTRLHVLDSDLRELPIGVAGELHIGGIQVGLGYHRQPELTAERFIHDPFASTEENATRGQHQPGRIPRLYKTGDLARWRHDGLIEYLGRLDFQVKLRGYRIELGEIEQHVAAIAGVDGALAMLNDGPLGPRLICYYVSPTDGVQPDQVIATLRRELPDFMVPSAMMRLDSWPVSPNGKVDRRGLPEPSVATHVELRGGPPRSAVERVICRLMLETLGLEQVGVESDFFALGGHSLLATRLIAQTSRMFRVSLTLRGFFMAPTVKGLAEAVTSAVGADRVEKIATLVERVQGMTPEERERLRNEQRSTQRSTGNS